MFFSTDSSLSEQAEHGARGTIVTAWLAGSAPSAGQGISYSLRVLCVSARPRSATLP